ncbi:hypothetical protein LUZ60_014520 [Juncus effusus]|nr:hypothetical protein LUZ60_014520 [Juncus effusus]
MRRIGSFLEDADSKRRKGDKRVQNWIKDVRDVSFLIEDVIDTFDLGRNKGSFRSLGRVLKKPVVLYKLNKEINKIQTMLGEIERSRASYGIENLPESSTVAHVRRPINPEIDNIDVIGFGAERNAIIELLLDERTPRRSVLSIVGIGGLGKTTLAQKVYQSEKVKKHFEVSVWLNISQEFNIPNLLKKMADMLSIKLAENEQEEEQFIPKIKEVLKRKRYLVVLDDIWTGDVWSEIMSALPDVKNGSRVLMTTRSLETAKAADPRNDPYKLRYLNDEESLDLLFKKAYVNQIANGSYPDDLLEPAKTISKKCGGLPLALIVAGGLLSTKDPTSVAWNKEIATMNWQRGENECMKILATSYEDLPINLKPCFVYLASFPEDWVYEAKLIIHLWVAEGFIPRDEPGTMEEIADKYLEELAQRCMIQNLERSLTNGSIKRFRVHDLLLNLYSGS